MRPSIRAIGTAVRLTGLLPTLLLAACLPDEPTPVDRDRPVRLGPGELFLRVVSVEVVSGSYVAGAEAPPGSGYLATLVRLDGADLAGGPSRQALTEKGVLDLMRGLAVEDAEGNRYERAMVLPAAQWRLMRSARTGLSAPDLAAARSAARGVPRDWAVLFLVPDGASGFRLLVENPRPREGEPSLAAVALGR